MESHPDSSTILSREQLVGSTVVRCSKGASGFRLRFDIHKDIEVLSKNLHLPAGYTLSWSGEYEEQEHAASQLRLMIPLVFLIIFLLLYFTLRDFKEAGVVMLSVPFALIGGVFLVALLGMNWSVAV